MANGTAASQATVVSGDARFEVLAPEVIRMEYSPSGSFLNDPTFDILDRNFAVPAYTSSVSNGWLTITTSQMTLRYQRAPAVHRGQHPDAAAGRAATGRVRERHARVGMGVHLRPGLPGGRGGAQRRGGDRERPPELPQPARVHRRADSATGADAAWQVLGAPAGNADVTIRYSNYVGALGGPAPRTESLLVNGTTTQVTLPATASWDAWSTVTVPVTLAAGTNTVAMDCESSDDCNVNIDDIAVTAPGASAAPFLPASPLGGYIRSYDSVNGSYSAAPACASGQAGATCTAAIPQMASGLLDESGWYLLDDSQTTVWTSNGWIASRPAGDIQDGYLFGYGQDYTGALADLAKLTGPAPLLPRISVRQLVLPVLPVLDRQLPGRDPAAVRG